MKGKRNRPAINRRQFVGTGIKLVALGSMLGSLGQSCNNKKDAGTGTTGADTTATKKSRISSKKARKKWNRNALVLNTKTNVLHFPTALLYTYYDEIKATHVQEISMAAWNPQGENAPKLNRQQSGNIMEILTLQELGKDINDSTLVIAIDTLSIAFDSAYEKANFTNFRLHELMLQLVALNNLIPASEKWITFNAKVKKPTLLRKRQKWMETEATFNERVNYIQNRRNDYITRLSQRAAKYSFS